MYPIHVKTDFKIRTRADDVEIKWNKQQAIPISMTNKCCNILKVIPKIYSVVVYVRIF